jgi:hypothetical protein
MIMMKDRAICNLHFHLATIKHIKINVFVASGQLTILLMIEDSSLLKQWWMIQIFYVLQKANRAGSSISNAVKCGQKLMVLWNIRTPFFVRQLIPNP